MEIGFVVVSHQNPRMLRRLVMRLNRSFDHPAIACHHDVHQCAIDYRAFPSNVRFVKESIRTRWADFSVVEAFRLALRQLYDWRAPDWFVYLSGSDYPIKSGDAIRSELFNSPYDAYLDHRVIRYDDLPGQKRDSGFELGFRRPYWLKIAYDRYVARRIRYLRVDRKGRLCTRYIAIRPPALAPPGPLKNGMNCYAGDAWMSARRRCAELLLGTEPHIRALVDYYRDCPAPDESFFHTILCNETELNLCNDNKRYEDWRSGSPNPKTLGLADLPDLLASTHHFARKFSDQHDSKVLDELDRLT